MKDYEVLWLEIIRASEDVVRTSSPRGTFSDVDAEGVDFFDSNFMSPKGN